MVYECEDCGSACPNQWKRDEGKDLCKSCRDTDNGAGEDEDKESEYRVDSDYFHDHNQGYLPRGL